MKKFYVLFVLLAFITNASAQVQMCPLGANFENQIAADSIYQRKAKDRSMFLHNPYANQNTTQSIGPLVVPVVVHIIHLNTEAVGQGLNITYAQVLSQIDRLNADYANDTVYTQLASGQWAYNAGIQFCLAKIPLGPTNWTNNTEPGVMRYAVASASTNIYNQIFDLSNQTTVNALVGLTHPSTNYFPFDRILNIWTVNEITDGGNANYAGYSPLPLLNTPYPLDGVLMDVHMFGDNTVNNNNFPNISVQYNTGNVLAHEVGHYFNLYHTFTGNCSGMTNADCQTTGDFICDTPPNQNTSASCNSTDGCLEINLLPWGNRPDMNENYMTWHDDNCINTFTFEQGTVMRNYLTFFRSSLVQDTNLALTGVAAVGGCLPPILSAAFNSPTNICVNQSALFQAYAGPGFSNSTFQWNFANASPTTSTLQNPSVTFNATGSQLVTLTVTDASSNTATESFYVYISPCAALASEMGNWYFGKHAGISFATGTGQEDNAAYLNNSMISYEASVSLSDTAGGLLFYTDGDTIWDRSHFAAITNLIGGPTDSKSQIIYAPHPYRSNWYYLFHSPAYETGLNTIRYSIIADSNGTIIPIQLNDTLARAIGQPGYGEQIAAIPHCNGRDTWIITTGLWGSNFNATAVWAKSLYVFLVSGAGVTNPDGVSPYPYVYQLSSANSVYEFWGELKANKDGTKLAFCSSNGAFLISFDPSTGILSNDSHIPGATGWKYGLSFSPDGNSLYMTDQSTHVIEGADISVPNPIFNIIVVGNTAKGGMQLGPDSCLYVIHDAVNGQYVDRFNNPNNLSSPGFVTNAVTLNATYGQIRSWFGFPNFIEAERPTLAAMSFNATPILCNTVAFYFPGCWHSAYSFLWNFGDNTTDTNQAILHQYAAPGTYTVTLTVTIGNFSYVISQPLTIYNSAPQIVGPTTFCSGGISQVNYTLPQGFTSYSWSITGGGNIISNNTTNTVLVSWSGSGTISCIVQSGQFCQFTSSLNVSFFQSPIVDAGQDTIISCLSSVVILGGSPSASGGLPPYSYQWIPASQLNNTATSNPICTLQASTTYTLNVTDANGCASSDVITVIVDSITITPPVIFNVPMQTCDFSNTLNLQNYATPVGGTFSGPGVTGTNFDALVAGGFGNYIVTYYYTGLNGCTTAAIDTIEVIQCCQVPPSSGVTTLDQQASSQYGSQFNTVPVPVRINGTFYINNNFLINGYSGTNSVRLAPNATIVVKAGAILTIQNNSVIRACSNGMPNGIIIEPGGELKVLTGSKIQDCQIAIHSMDGAKYTVNQSTLSANYRNIVVDPFTGQGAHPGTIVRSMVLGTSLTLTPYNGQKTYSGMEITGVDSIVVGIPSTITDINQWRNMDFGIIEHSSHVSIRNNSFTGITNNTVQSIPGCCITNTCQNASICNPAPKGTAIWADGNWVQVGGPTTAYSNSFSGCTKGVLAENNIVADVRNNTFQNINSTNGLVPTFCIEVQHCVNTTVDISFNTMTNTKNPIVFRFGKQTTAKIENNTIINLGGTGIQVLQTTECPVSIGFNAINASANTTSIGKYGIRVSNAVVTNTTPYVEVHGNTTKRCEKHIWVTSFPFIHIDSLNYITCQNAVSPTTNFGIQIQNSSYALVDGNNILRSLPGLPTDTNFRTRLYGISMETNCFKTQVSNNGLTRLGTGIQYFNVNNYPSTISCNTMTNNMRGVLLNNTFIGHQGEPPSSLNPTGIDQDNYWAIASSQAGIYKAIWGINTVSTNWYYRTNNANLHPPTIYLFPTPVVSFVGPQANAPNLCAVGCWNCNLQNTLAQVASRTAPFDTMPYTSLFVSEQSTYEQLRQDPSLLSMGTQYDSTLTRFYNERQFDNIGYIDEAYLKASLGDTAGAAIAKDGISPNGNPDMNHKIVLEIYLRSWAVDKPYFSSQDSATLYNIAIQNVTYGGKAVYDARVMLDIDIDDIGFGSATRLANSSSEVEVTFGKLYPNPTNGTAIYQAELSEGESGQIVITDIFGRQVLTKQLAAGYNEVQLDLSELPSGIYLYQAIINDEKRQTGKIILNK